MFRKAWFDSLNFLSIHTTAKAKGAPEANNSFSYSYRLSCVPQNSYVETLTPASSE